MIDSYVPNDLAFGVQNVDNVAPQQQRAPKSGTAFIPDLEVSVASRFITMA